MSKVNIYDGYSDLFLPMNTHIMMRVTLFWKNIPVFMTAARTVNVIIFLTLILRTAIQSLCLSVFLHPTIYLKMM